MTDEQTELDRNFELMAALLPSPLSKVEEEALDLIDKDWSRGLPYRTTKSTRMQKGISDMTLKKLEGKGYIAVKTVSETWWGKTRPDRNMKGPTVYVEVMLTELGVDAVAEKKRRDRDRERVIPMVKPGKLVQAKKPIAPRVAPPPGRSPRVNSNGTPPRVYSFEERDK